MKTKLNLLLITIFIAFVACESKEIKKPNSTISKHEVKTEQIFPENSIGVAYLDTIIDDKYTLTIRFPNSNLSKFSYNRDTSNFLNDIKIDLPPQTILLFDERGQLIKLDNVKNCNSTFWCENDGGLQYDPTYKVTIDEKDFELIPKLQDKKRLDNISCFAVINYNPHQFKSFSIGKENKNVAMRGRLSKDYTGYADGIKDSIYMYYDRNAEIIVQEDESEMAENCIILHVYNNESGFELGCCGP